MHRIGCHLVCKITTYVMRVLSSNENAAELSLLTSFSLTVEDSEVTKQN